MCVLEVKERSAVSRIASLRPSRCVILVDVSSSRVVGRGKRRLIAAARGTISSLFLSFSCRQTLCTHIDRENESRESSPFDPPFQSLHSNRSSDSVTATTTAAAAAGLFLSLSSPSLAPRFPLSLSHVCVRAYMLTFDFFVSSDLFQCVITNHAARVER